MAIVVGSQPVTAPIPASALRAAQRAEMLLWLAWAFFLAGVGVGTGWDRHWHASHPFEDFWSPPHLFIYANVLLSAAVVIYVTFNARLRAAFGASQSLSPFPFAVPRGLMLLGAGFLVIALGGVADDFWHTTFGLDETNWSLPHAMLGHGILLAALGFTAALLALGKTVRWWASGLLAWVTLGVATDLIGGPILHNPPPDALRRIAQVPVLAADPFYQHTSRIYLTWHLDRTNWLYLPMLAFSIGLGLRLTQRLTGPRDRWLVAVSALAFALALLDRELDSVWARLLLAPPFLPAALGFAAVHRLGGSRMLAWGAAGCVACAVSLVWVPDPLAALAFGPLTLLGVWLAERLLRVMESPSRQSVIVTATIVGFALPALTGTLDLYWRTHTP